MIKKMDKEQRIRKMDKKKQGQAINLCEHRSPCMLDASPSLFQTQQKHNHVKHPSLHKHNSTVNLIYGVKTKNEASKKALTQNLNNSQDKSKALYPFNFHELSPYDVGQAPS